MRGEKCVWKSFRSIREDRIYLLVSKGIQLNITRRNENKEHQTVTETEP